MRQNRPRRESSPRVRPGFFFWGSVPVRIFGTPDGGLDCERFDRRTGKFVRDLRMISEIYFNPGGSTDIEEVGAKEFTRRVEDLRRESDEDE